MERVLSVAHGGHLLVLVGIAFAASVGSLSAADHYYVNDHLATTTAVTDAAGEIAAIEADAFGTPVAGATQAARYTGKPYDDDIGAFVFPFRNYRSDEARWMSADPSGFPDGVNSVSYAPIPTFSCDALGLYKVVVNGNITAPSQDQVFTIPTGQNSASVSVTGNFSLTYLFGGSAGAAISGNTAFNYSALLRILDNYGQPLFSGTPATGTFSLSPDLANNSTVLSSISLKSLQGNLGAGSYMMQIAVSETWSGTTTKGSGNFSVRRE